MPQRKRPSRKSRTAAPVRKAAARRGAAGSRNPHRRGTADLQAVVDALNRCQAVIEFAPDGTILYANETFLKAVHFTLEELRGRHHSLFVDPAEHGTPAYHEFWARLARGEFHSGQFRRIGRDGHEVWIQASYNPVFDTRGKVVKVVKFATEITQQVRTAQQMNQTVAEAGELARAAAVGNLTMRLSVEGKSGPMAELSRGVNALLDTMSALVGRAKSAADEVARGAEEISQGNTNLSQRTEEQASSLQQTASSMEEMTSTVRQNADNASEANQLALAAREQAERGGTVVAHAVRSMSEINESSRRIADIIGVIDDIAFQTNLLALNAAVEAARAGDQGRGFAVVASEVRNLAGRSASAAKEIKALIQDSVRKVEEGSGLVTQSGATLEQIIVAVKKVTDIVGEISAASREQSSGIEQVSKAIVQLDQLTQQNASLVEQASAASQSMAEHARGLNDTLQGYEVRDEFMVAATLERGPSGSATPRHGTTPGLPARQERRSPERPWAQRPQGIAGNAAENVWEEF